MPHENGLVASFPGLLYLQFLQFTATDQKLEIHVHLYRRPWNKANGMD